MHQNEVEEDLQSAIDTYKELYVEKYQREPLSQQIGVAVLRALVRQHGLDKILALLRQFFAGNGDKDWYQRQGHSMECFAKSMGSLNAALGTVEKKEHRQRTLMLSVDSVCPKCKEYFKLILNAKDVGLKTHFTLCPSCNSYSVR